MKNLSTPLSKLIGRDLTVTSAQSIGGGCISQAFRIVIEESAGGTQRTYFVKRNSADLEENFDCEREGLGALGQANVCGVPDVVTTGVVEANAYLVLQWIETVPTRQGFFQSFGEKLAKLHRQTRGNEIGWHRDNFLGAAPQWNSPTTTWSEFVADRRIGFQIRWAVDQGIADSRLKLDCERIVAKMNDLLDGRDDETSLLHGDLWSGNYLSDTAGQPVIIDPAVYRGCREAEFGMIRLFGGCGPDFESAYQAVWPMNDGWQRRVNVYVLYHLLNHLNLFGSGYLGQSREMAQKILAQYSA